MKKPIVNSLEPSQQQLNNLIKYYQTGRYVDAEKLSLSITQEFPKHQFGWKVLGATLKQMGKINESLIASQTSAQLEPQDTEVHNNLGVILQELGRFEEAEQSLKQAIKLKLDFAEAHNNLGNTLKELGRLEEAEASYRQAITLKPDYAEAHNNLGVMLQGLGRLEEAEQSLKQAIKLKLDFARAHNNLGNTLKELSRLEEAETSYRKAIELKPDYDIAHNNLGIALKELGRLEEAEISLRQAITLKPDYAEAHNNLGVMLQGLGRLDEAEASYRKAIALKPDYVDAWNNIFFSLQVIKLQSSSIEDHLPLLDEQVNSKYPQILKSILNYRLNLGNPSTDKSFKDVLNILSSTDNTFIKNPEVSYNELIKPTLPEKITALVPFGRSGTGLMHSLIDGHPEVSTLPSIYFSEFFDHSIWEKIIAGGWEEMVDRFALTYEVLFDASSAIKVASKGNQTINNIGQKEGMTTVGTKRDEVLSVNKNIFIKELKKLMDYHNHLDQFTFFKLVHSAYDKALQDLNKKKLIFYHIHNPDTYAQFNFLRLAPNTNWLVMVREPLQSCESWVREAFPGSYINIVNKIDRKSVV